MTNIAKANQFALITTGIGYLSRVRSIEPEAGLPFLAVTLSALRGLDGDVRYTYIDCRVLGRSCHTYVSQLTNNVEAGDKVLIRFRLHDLHAETFKFRHGPRKGETGVNVKAKLVGIDWARVNGVAFSIEEQQADAV